MRRNSKQSLIIEEAYKRGYRVNESGLVLGLKGQLLVLSLSSSGYYSFNIRYDKEFSTRVFVHRLQAYQKFGAAIFEVDIVVRHLNGISTDNSESNILIGSHSDNMMDKPELSRRLDASSPKYDHESIIEDSEGGLTYKEIMKKYSISSKGTVSFIINKSLKRQGIK